MNIRVAMVTDYPQKEGLLCGGVETVSYSLVNYLANNKNVDMHVISVSKNVKQKHIVVETKNNLTIHWIPGSTLPGFIAYWTITRRRIHKCLKIINPKITHYQGMAGWLLNFPYPHIFTIHGIAEKEVAYSDKPFVKLRTFIIRVIETLGRKKASNVIIINKYILEELGTQIKGNTWEIANPIDKGFFKINRLENVNNILFVGRVTKLKNIDGLLRIFNTIKQRNKNASLTFAGQIDSGEYFNECQEYIKNNDLTQNVTFLGPQNKEMLRLNYSRASCLVLLSHQENSPMVIAEAMASGIPVVASNICGIPYMVENKRTGYLVNQENEEEVAEIILTLLENNILNEDMGIYAREIAYSKYHIDRVGDQTYNAYKSILETRLRHG